MARSTSAVTTGTLPRRSQRPRTPLVGRQRELALIEARLRDALDGSGNVTFVAGEPGIGKTRLLSEAISRADALGFTVLRGNCYEAEEALPYRPWAEVLRVFRAAHPESYELALGPESTGGVFRIAPDLRPEASAELSPSDRLQMFDSLAAFFLDAARSRPLLIAIEDLHWADSSSLALLQHISRRLGDARLAFVGSFRDAEVGPEHALAPVIAESIEKRTGTRIHLEGLDASATREMLGSLLGVPAASVRPRLAEAVYAQTEGNPFFVEEVCQHLLETGSLVELDGRRDLADSAALGLPEGVKDLLQLRLRRLPPVAREALAAAAVLGRQFEFSVLEAMTGLPQPALLEALDAAVRARLVREPDGQAAAFEFVHALVQQTLTESIAGPRRQQMHLGAAQAIETVHASNVDRYARQLAEHYLATGEQGLEKLERYADTAVAQAMQAFAMDEARTLLLDAIEALGLQSRSRAAARFVARHVDALYRTSSFELRRDLCETSAEVLWEAADDGFAAIATMSAAQTYSGSGRRDLLDFPKALAMLTRAIAALERVGDRPNLGIAKGHLVNVLFQTGKVAEADRIAEGEMREGAGPARQMATMFHAFYACYLGRLQEGRRLQERSFDEVALQDQPIEALFHYRVHLHALRAPAVSRFNVERCLADERKHGPFGATLQAFRWHALRVEGHRPSPEVSRKVREWRDFGLGDEAREDLNAVDFLDGNWHDACSFQSDYLLRTERSGGKQIIAMSSAVVGEAERVCGRFAEASRLLHRSASLEAPLSAVVGHAGLALVAAESGEYHRIAAHAAACRAAMNDDDWLGLGARVILAEALALLASGKRTEADACFEFALSEMRRVEHAWDPADAHYVYGKMLTNLGDEGAAAVHFQEAITIYERIEAGEPFFDRVRAAWPNAPARSVHHLNGSVAGLSAREIEVLRLLARGSSNPQIAEHLTVSRPTVATHVRHILEKTGTANRTEAATWAIRNNLT